MRDELKWILRCLHSNGDNFDDLNLEYILNFDQNSVISSRRVVSSC